MSNQIQNRNDNSSTYENETKFNSAPKVFFVRHGQSVRNLRLSKNWRNEEKKLNIHQEITSDPFLTIDGVENAIHGGLSLHDSIQQLNLTENRIDYFMVSPLSRTLQTAYFVEKAYVEQMQGTVEYTTWTIDRRITEAPWQDDDNQPTQVPEDFNRWLKFSEYKTHSKAEKIADKGGIFIENTFKNLYLSQKAVWTDKKESTKYDRLGQNPTSLSGDPNNGTIKSHQKAWEITKSYVDQVETIDDTQYDSDHCTHVPYILRNQNEGNPLEIIKRKVLKNGSNQSELDQLLQTKFFDTRDLVPAYSNKQQEQGWWGFLYELKTDPKYKNQVIVMVAHSNTIKKMFKMVGIPNCGLGNGEVVRYPIHKLPENYSEIPK